MLAQESIGVRSQTRKSARVIRKISLLSCCIGFLPGFTLAPQVDRTRLLGPDLDEAFLDRFIEITRQPRPITLALPGGKGSLALDVADVIRARQVPIQIVAGCHSACAEAIIPAASDASKVTFLDLSEGPVSGPPTVGVHHNPVIVRALFRRLGRRDFDRCYGRDYQRFIALRGNTPKNRRLWRKQERYLQVQDSSVQRTTPCAEVRIRYLNQEWFPTSRQLREEFGYRFTGSVCADSLECMTQALASTQRLGSTFVIGDTRYRLDKGSQNDTKLTPIAF